MYLYKIFIRFNITLLTLNENGFILKRRSIKLFISFCWPKNRKEKAKLPMFDKASRRSAVLFSALIIFHGRS